MRLRKNGFTLIELIMVLVLGGIVAAFLVPFLGSALTKSHEPLDNLDRAAGLSSDMAKVMAVWNSTIQEECYNSTESIFKNCIQNKIDSYMSDKGLALVNSNIDQINFEKFVSSVGIFNVNNCLEPDYADCELIKVVLKGSKNSGEVLNYYFTLFLFF